VQPQTILIADDSADDVLLTKHQFEKSKIINPIQVVSNGESVINYLEGNGAYRDREKFPYPILLLLDLRMPRKGGLEVLEWQQTHSRHNSLPIIMFTGSSDVKEMNRAYQLGARSFLTKPVSFADFSDAIQGVQGVNFKLVRQGFRLEGTPIP
jgi:CheY-like chemotaxis protein